MIFIILALIGVVGLILASYFDIKTREIPNIISFTMIALGLGLRLIYSVINKEIMFFVYGLLAFGIFFLFGVLMYYTKQWGGGDTKLLMALGALFGTWSTDYFLLSLIITLIFVAAVYGLVWAVYLTIKNYRKFSKIFKQIYYNKKIQTIIISVFAVLLILVSLIIEDKTLGFVLTIMAFLVLIYYYLLIYLKVVEKACMEKTIPVSKLTEGDWVIHDVKKGNKLIYSKKYNITKKHIEILNKYKIKEVTIKEGFPFVPAFLLALIINFLISKILVRFLLSFM
ncbi:MAG: A24 family peptidase [Candidatus Nanoarchaeia archaeon]|nr:A24 family peptidase [Candidatus Nanoarchaeia archaeon]